MLTLLLGPLNKFTTRSRILRARMYWGVNTLMILGLTVMLAALMLRRTPNVALIAWMVYLTGLMITIMSPRWGLYLLVFFSLVGDSSLMVWYPFWKNFSSHESILFVHDALIISPLETYLIVAYLSWLLRGALTRRVRFFTGTLFWPAMVFLGFLLAGLGYGLAKDGDLTIALWELRPLIYMVAIFVLASNVLTEREHYNYLFWAAMSALFIEGLAGSYYFFVILGGSLAGVSQITEHSAAIHMNTLFLFFCVSLLYRVAHSKRIAPPLMIPFVLIAYLASQRRAGFIALFIALALLVVVLFFENRKLFWVIVPLASCVGLMYLAVFWNSSGALGLPARAVKSVLAPSQASYEDYTSNIYRTIENINLEFTIHERPLTGVGFGQKFYVVVPMADISFFEWWQYFPHNSIVWIWLKSGVGGFIAMLYLLGLTLLTGTRALMRMPKNDLSVYALVATLYVVMHFIYAYVDISWDSQSMVYLGAMLGVINSLEHVVTRPVSQPAPRWPWQTAPSAVPEIRPLFEN